jgi:Virulence-associated protein E-like domain/Bifunctional DNA primase/polymerase, N-terminal/Primase C terminal 2 (PriCT-2)
MSSKGNAKPQPTPDPDGFNSYAGSGWQCIPLHKWNSKSEDKRTGRVRDNGKRPRDFDWTRRTYASEKVIAGCIREGRNVGVRLIARQLVVDVDPRNGGKEGFARLCRDLNLNPEWPRVETGSGGSHYYLTLPDGVRVVDTLEAYKGVEFKSVGRQVVAAGSVHPNGNPYFWDGIDHPSLADAPEAPSVLVAAIRRPERAGKATDAGTYTQEQITKALGGLDVTEYRDHDKWLRLMMACHHASNGDARDEFVDWSTGDPEFADHAEIIGRRWDSLHADNSGDRITAATLNKILADAGQAALQVAADATGEFEAMESDEDAGADWLETGDTSTSTDIVPVESRGLKLNRYMVATDTYENACSAIIRAGIVPEWDDLKQNVVFRQPELPWDDSYGRVLTDHVARMIRLYLVNHFQGVAFSPGKDNLFEALMTLAYCRKFNPVLEYLDTLKWDGIERVPKLFGHYFNCGDDAYTRAVSKCFMVGAVRRARNAGSKFDTMPVLKSPQGWNKSTAVKTLFGAQWYSDADLGDLRSKDAAMKLRDIWVQEFAEIESLTRNETGNLKAFLSRATDRQRDPYGRVVENAPRRCVMMATVNEGGYLKDSTGGRRFWPLELSKRIDLAPLARDRDQLWAEASICEARGDSDVLPQKLWSVAGERQAEQSTDDPWADTIQNFASS